jgi:hypothetical protein
MEVRNQYFFSGSLGQDLPSYHSDDASTEIDELKMRKHASLREQVSQVTREKDPIVAPSALFSNITITISNKAAVLFLETEKGSVELCYKSESRSENLRTLSLYRTEDQKQEVISSIKSIVTSILDDLFPSVPRAGRKELEDELMNFLFAQGATEQQLRSVLDRILGIDDPSVEGKSVAKDAVSSIVKETGLLAENIGPDPKNLLPFLASRGIAVDNSRTIGVGNFAKVYAASIGSQQYVFKVLKTPAPISESRELNGKW